MDYINSTPAADGFRMPAEFERHQGCIMIWPERPGSWAYGAKAAKKAFAQIASVISESEQVYMIVSEGRKEEAAKMLPETVRLVVMDTDDAWARDTGPTFVVSGNVDTPYEARDLRGINWEFNAWGGTYDGLYADWDNDNLVAGQFMSYLGCQGYNAAPFVLEGGSIHTDGEGTMLVTESCLLSKGRNPELTKVQIENKLKQYCNVSKACLSVLENVTDAKGRHIKVRKMLIPKKPVCITEEELNGFEFEEGEDMREAGERLAASYVNFYIANDSVIVPQFDDEADSLAVNVLKEAFPDRKIVGIYARDIIVGGGNIHCITQQIPEVK